MQTTFSFNVASSVTTRVSCIFCTVRTFPAIKRMAYELKITRVLWHRVLRHRCWKRSILYPFFSQFRKRRGITALFPLQLVAYRTNLTASISISSAIGIYIVLHCHRDKLSLLIPRRRSLYTDVRTITKSSAIFSAFDTLDFSPPYAYGVDIWLAWWYAGTVREYLKVIKNIYLFCTELL